MDKVEDIAAGGRRERSERRAPAAGVGVAAVAETPLVGKRRRHSAAYKFLILEEADRCGRGELGSLLRREGLYHSTIIKWRLWRDKMADQGLEPSSGRESEKNLRKELKRLERENQRLTLHLKKTKGLVELQKKALELLEDMDQEDERSESS